MAQWNHRVGGFGKPVTGRESSHQTKWYANAFCFDFVEFFQVAEERLSQFTERIRFPEDATTTRTNGKATWWTNVPWSRNRGKEHRNRECKFTPTTSEFDFKALKGLHYITLKTYYNNIFIEFSFQFNWSVWGVRAVSRVNGKRCCKIKWKNCWKSAPICCCDFTTRTRR